MSSAIQKLIRETERWLAEHRAERRHAEAAACAVRLQALKDAEKAVREERIGQ